MNQVTLNTMNNHASSTAEQQWFATLDGFRVIGEDVAHKAEAERRRAEAQVESLRQAFKVLPAPPADCKAAVDGLGLAFEAVTARWMQQWGENALARQLADAFADRLVLLVLGKVNAGKSSLINFLARRAAADGLTVKRFILDEGKRVDKAGDFQVGSTETTSTLQGVEIGQRLLLLDSPGLHSVTPANQALTERFMAAADGALLLTNAGAPGNREELSALVEDLTESQRPILVAITRSDKNEADEVDGQLVDRCVNLPASERQDQENYVLDSARQALLATGAGDDELARLWAPVSLSVHYAETEGATAEAMAAAGLERLYQALHALAEQALSYKREKPLQLVHEHRRQLKARLEGEVLPRLASARQAGTAAADSLAERAPSLVESVSATGLRCLFEALQRHTADRDVNAALEEVEEELGQHLRDQVGSLMASYNAELDQLLVAIDPQDLGSYDEAFVSFEQTSGSGWRAVGSTTGAVAGAVAGSFIPVVGNLVGAIGGALFGSLAGRAVGSLGVRTHTAKELVGVSFEQLQAAVAPRMEQAVEQAVSHALSRCSAALDKVDAQLALIEQKLSTFANDQRPGETE